MTLGKLGIGSFKLEESAAKLHACESPSIHMRRFQMLHDHKHPHTYTSKQPCKRLSTQLRKATAQMFMPSFTAGPALARRKAILTASTATLLTSLWHGNRYEIWCVARASGCRYCLVHTDVPDAIASSWNTSRAGETYSSDVYKDLAGRFEIPDSKNRQVVWPMLEPATLMTDMTNSRTIVRKRKLQQRIDAEAQAAQAHNLVGELPAPAELREQRYSLDFMSAAPQRCTGL